MDQLRRILDSIAKQIGALSATQKLLIGSLVVILGMTLFLVSQYAGKQTRVAPVPTLQTAEFERATQKLRLVGIQSFTEGGSLLVNSEDEFAARAALLEDGFVSPNDKALLFENILQRQSWTNSRQQNEKLYQVALQNELRSCIQLMRNIKTAQVLIDVPDSNGFGPRMKTPTAAITVQTRDGSPMNQAIVNAVAGVVSGSVAGLQLTNIRVIDASSGRQMRPTGDDEQQSTSYLEHASRVEGLAQDKFQDLLSYIPGVVVAVTAQVDVTRSQSQVVAYSPENKGTVSLEKERTKSVTTNTQTQPSATPGVTANQTADITTASVAAGSSQNTEETTVSNDIRVGQKTETIVDPKGYPTLVAVSVNVPRGYVASLIKPAQGATNGPSDGEVDQKFTASVKPMIVESLVPQLRALMVQNGQSMTASALKSLAEEMISVSMIPAELPVAPASGGAMTAGVGSGFLAMGSGLIDKAVLGILAVVALGMMVMMVRKAGKPTNTPTAEELVGLPPRLESSGDIIGEAEAAQEALAGIEVDETQVQNQHMLTQIDKMIKDDPKSAARLLNRWIEVEQ